MCGRFTQHYTWREIHDLYRLTAPSSPTNLRPRYNICPTTTIDAVFGHELVSMRWGLIPGWWGKPLKEMRLATFNARAETVAEKPMFRSAFKTKRCLIPASGYYERRGTPEGKQPYYFTRRAERSPWSSRQNQEPPAPVNGKGISATKSHCRRRTSARMGGCNGRGRSTAVSILSASVPTGWLGRPGSPAISRDRPATSSRVH
jgi:hypothetical protein